MCTTCGCGEGNLYIEGDEHNPHSAFRSAPFAPAARPKMKITGIKAPEFTPSQTEEGDLHYGHGEAGDPHLALKRHTKQLLLQPPKRNMLLTGKRPL